MLIQIFDLCGVALVAFMFYLATLSLFKQKTLEEFNPIVTAIVCQIILWIMRLKIVFANPQGGSFIFTTNFGGEPFDLWFGLVEVAVFGAIFWFFWPRPNSQDK